MFFLPKRVTFTIAKLAESSGIGFSILFEGQLVERLAAAKLFPGTAKHRLQRAGNAIDQLLYKRSIVRVSSLHYHFYRGFGGGFVSEDPEGFLGPVDLSAGNMPAEAACVAQFLSFGQIRFTSPQ